MRSFWLRLKEFFESQVFDLSAELCEDHAIARDPITSYVRLDTVSEKEPINNEARLTLIKKLLQDSYHVRFYDDDTTMMANGAWQTCHEIHVGKFDNIEHELISIFHEIGHIKINKRFIARYKFNTLMIELECWRVGIELAQKNDIYFSDDSIAWGYAKAMTYKGHDQREDRAWLEHYGKFITMQHR
jgi:hypothetical protein